MLIVDEKKTIQDPTKFDAKTAAIIGFQCLDQTTSI